MTPGGSSTTQGRPHTQIMQSGLDRFFKMREGEYEVGWVGRWGRILEELRKGNEYNQNTLCGFSNMKNKIIFLKGLFIMSEYSAVCICAFVIYSSTEGHLSCSHIVAAMNKTAVNVWL